eukprot:6881542-Prorocentrum_lima.AAC.1
MPHGMPAMIPGTVPSGVSSAAAAELDPSEQQGRTRKGRPGDTGDRTLSPEVPVEAGPGGAQVRHPSAATSGSEE